LFALGEGRKIELLIDLAGALEGFGPSEIENVVRATEAANIAPLADVAAVRSNE
jgi:hypothetical protein